MSPHPPLLGGPATAADASPRDPVTVVVILVAIAAAAATTRLPKMRQVPPVLLLLAAGMATRVLFHSVVSGPTLKVITRGTSDLTLSLVGFVIGSHLNRETLSGLGVRTAWYLAGVFGVTFAVVDLVASALFPAQRAFAPFVAAIALERSSPAALANIGTNRAKGPYTNATLLTCAAMDCMALVAFVVCNAALGDSSESAALTLARIALGTALGAGLVVGVVKGSERVAEQRGLPASSTWLPIALAAAVILAGLHRVLHLELLLSAIVGGSILNFRSTHPITPALEDSMSIIHVLLFAPAGLRIDLVAMSSHLSPVAVVALYAARLGGLWAGSAGAAKALGLPHPHWRCLGLVTQLAIALSLVARLHDHYPDSAPLADAAAGAVLLNLVTGPPLLAWALRGTGEAGASGTTAASPLDIAEAGGSTDDSGGHSRAA